MMLQEFTDLTGIEPTTEEYCIIEEMYYNFDGNKKAFCKDFIDTNGLEAVRKQVVNNLHEELTHAYTKIRQQTREIAILKKMLEKEQEWHPYESEHNVKQAAYEELAASSATKELSDEEAIDLIVKEYGFDRSKITIVHDVAKEEINRHHQCRAIGTYVRKALFNAWDWNYVLFNVKSNTTINYEMYNGQLQMHWD